MSSISDNNWSISNYDYGDSLKHEVRIYINNNKDET